MKSVLITFDQAYYERIMRCSTVWVAADLLTSKRYRDVAPRLVTHILEAMHGLVCVRLSLRWSMTVK